MSDCWHCLAHHGKEWSCDFLPVGVHEAGGGIRLISKVSSCSLYFICPVPFSPPLPTALLYKPIDRVTRSTLVLHVSVRPLNG